MSDQLFARFGHEYQAGDVLFREGERGDVMFVIQSGAVRITKQIGAVNQVFAVLGAGEFLGEMAILNGKPRTATATVVDDTRCLVVDAKILETMVAKNAEIAIRLITKLASRLDTANALVAMLMHRDPRARVLLALAHHADTFGVPSADGVRVRTTATKIANDVGVDVTVVHEVVARLGRLQLLSEDDGDFLIADVGRLHDFLEFIEMPQKFGGES